MPCYSPITGYRSRYLSENGKRPIVFQVKDGFIDMPVTVPCGRCIGCRLEHSRQWAIRCMHEAQMHEHSSFITLTFDPEHLPDDYSINKEHLQKFFKRLRKNTGKELRYFACGEYGEKTSRPHYHAIIFGDIFPDKTLHTQRGDHFLYRSKTLEKAWPFGHSLIGEVSFESAAYVARYVMKKRKGKPDEIDPKTGKTNEEHYSVINPHTGELHKVEPEFALMSRRPGIGKTWLEKYHTDTDKDFITMRGTKHKLPKYYDSILQTEDELDMIQRKSKRQQQADKNKDDNRLDRLRVKEKVKLAQIKTLSRNLEELPK